MFISYLFALLFIFASAHLIAAICYKMYRYFIIPAPLKITTTPAPVTKTGVAFRLFREIVFFESLFKSTKWTWIFGWVFHLALVLVLIRHIRYFADPVSMVVGLIQPFGMYAGFAMLFGLAGLLARRLLVDRIKYITGPSDLLMLALLLLIGASGLLMKFIFRTDIVALKSFFQGIIYFDWQLLPLDPMLIIHLTLVLILMFIFPYSKLLHAPGIFFSPTRNQVDNPRENRHLANWARKLEASDGS